MINHSIQEMVKGEKRFYDNKYSKSDFKHLPMADNALIQTLISKYNLQGSCAIDLGCGTGWWTYLFNKNGVNCYGVDISSIGIQKGREKFGNVELIVGDALNLPFKYESFDFIFCSGLSLFSIEDLQEVKDIGNEFLRYLKEGGLFFITWASDLSNKRSSNTWMNHNLKNWENYLSNLNCEIIDVCFTHRFFFLILKSYALNNILTKILSKMFSIMPLRGKFKYARGNIFICAKKRSLEGKK